MTQIRSGRDILLFCLNLALNQLWMNEFWVFTAKSRLSFHSIFGFSALIIYFVHFTEQTSSVVCWITHINFVEGVAEEEQRSAQRQLGAGVRARLQPLVPGFFSKVEQLLQLQSPGPNTPAQQAQTDPEPAHHLSDTTNALWISEVPGWRERGRSRRRRVTRTVRRWAEAGGAKARWWVMDGWSGGWGL